jgi:hypothetical protein
MELAKLMRLDVEEFTQKAVNAQNNYERELSVYIPRREHPSALEEAQKKLAFGGRGTA